MTPPLSDHFNGKTFTYPGTPGSAGGRGLDVLRWKLSSHPARWPDRVPLAPQPPPPAPRGDEIVATWIGHASFLVQTAAANFLTDPVFSDRVSPLQWAGPKRVHPPGIAFGALTRIDVVLLSHDHYDHCDIHSLRRLAMTHNPLFIAPLRHGDLLAEAGAQRVIELDWWESHTVASGPTVTLVPTKHWSNRLGGTPRNHRLWGGFYVHFFPAGPRPTGAQPSRRLWFAGDSGYDGELFRTIGRKYGRPDLALIPIGAYEPRWFMKPMHMNPEEAIATHKDVGARRSIGMHWGTFQLTDEGRDEPVTALAAARAASGVAEAEFMTLAPGETLVAG